MPTSKYLIRLHYLTFLMLFLAVGVSSGQELGIKISQDGLLSYQAPEGWAISADRPGSKFDVAYDASRTDCRPIIKVTVLAGQKSLPQCLEDLKQQMASHGDKLIDEQSFETTLQQKGIRLVSSVENIFMFGYFFEDSSNQLFYLGCACPVSEGNHYAPIFDASMKTFNFQ